MAMKAPGGLRTHANRPGHPAALATYMKIQDIPQSGRCGTFVSVRTRYGQVRRRRGVIRKGPSPAQLLNRAIFGRTRASKSVLGWTLGDRGTETAQRLAAQLPHAPQVKFATDFWHPYAKIFGGQNHVQGKAHTFTIESLNHRIRCYLARLKRRTHNDSKSKENLAASILFFIVHKCGGELVPNTKSIPV